METINNIVLQDQPPFYHGETVLAATHSYNNPPLINLSDLTLTFPLMKKVSTSAFARRERISKIHWVKMKGVWRSNQWQFRIIGKVLIADVENIN